ncbi:uncharacterized protein LOC135086066 [Ostrinia nubilalis]|uniref:uncharacterized protein LOC135086066 n=1 Tax=Ostrinia nubilalis TaxID=29057 RepID=UPI00308253E0
MMFVAVLLACCAFLTSVVGAPDKTAVNKVDLYNTSALSEVFYPVGEGVSSNSTRVFEVAEALAKSENWTNPPPYIQSLRLLKFHGAVLKELLPREKLPITDHRRHYVLIAGVLAGMVEYLNSDCTPPDYDHEFIPIVDVLVPIVWQDPHAAVEKLDGFIQDIKDSVRVIQTLVDWHCIKIKDPERCNRVIQAYAYNDPDNLEDSLDLLVLVGELAEIYASNNYAGEASNYNSVRLLITGQKKLKPLIEKGAEVYNRLYGEHCVP